MRKGQATHQAILSRAMILASRIGLEGLTIGKLASDLRLSKSGLFAHFQAKEKLQTQVLDTAAGSFLENVVRPALQAPRGEPRVRKLFENWIDWAKHKNDLGGCIFVSAAAELDDRPGPVRDHLVKIQEDWFRTRARVVKTAVEEGHFAKDTDIDQFAHDLYGIALNFHHAFRLMKDPKAEKRAIQAFETLILNVKSTKSPSKK